MTHHCWSKWTAKKGSSHGGDDTANLRATEMSVVKILDTTFSQKGRSSLTAGVGSHWLLRRSQHTDSIWFKSNIIAVSCWLFYDMCHSSLKPTAMQRYVLNALEPSKHQKTSDVIHDMPVMGTVRRQPVKSKTKNLKMRRRSVPRV